MPLPSLSHLVNAVALLTEGVDRNKSADYIPQKEWKSPSSRRAWIEMLLGPASLMLAHSRPPHGGRG